ncbi:enoyl-CoA hydratase/isomerase family protein [Sporichthya sp.]|uniref:enoyl-CoA hydratase/isomerase family protein n=1 Tax=Sporichthya sp. TaxID=65475 RepID=UPI00183C994B|nr:enoyl-CoA hydratase/isomerase family protein [Sporichthya sp.]MBA3741423.1 enoyl-CoA hydratase/isomerase family protein [Sporichthya sp.]
MADFPTLIVERDGPVLTIKVVPLRESHSAAVGGDLHRELGLFLDQLRHDYSVRVIVLTGAEDGEFIVSPPRPEQGHSASSSRATTPAGQWSIFMGLTHTIQTMVDLEIPIVAKVNGDAVGFGQSVMFACDLILAREDSMITDMHLSMGDVYTTDGRGPIGLEWGVAPGDGAGALVPMSMSPPLAKEYLMLSRRRTGLELARAGVINRAVKADELDDICDSFVRELLARPPYALGWTKRIVNARVKDQLNRSLDASVAYEMVGFMHQAHGGAPTGYPSAADHES